MSTLILKKVFFTRWQRWSACRVIAQDMTLLLKPSHSVFLLNVTMISQTMLGQNTVRRSLNLIPSKYFNLYSIINTLERGKNSLLSNLTVIYSHLEDKRSRATGPVPLNIFYKELH